MNPEGIIARSKIALFLRSAEGINITKDRSLAIILRDVSKTEETPAASVSYLFSLFLSEKDHITRRLNGHSV